jgi:hypothetical protein
MPSDYSPLEFMKMRRPERFSDSKLVTEAKLNSSILEYKLDSITNRNQERDFETFCVKLAQLEICPNLRTQTGPVGGGDSKADSETYPVSDEIDSIRYEGVANAGTEKWAFAISAKKDWVTKARKDVLGIAGTSRGYTKAFFITNQFAPDKKRASIEDELSLKYKLAVTILDRTWILDRVFGNSRERLAITELNLGDGLESKTEFGPLDFERDKEFQKLNDTIEGIVLQGQNGMELIRIAIRAATLGSELQKPKDQVLGLFDRAIRFAEQHGSLEQVFDAKYQKAWKCYFWFEDFELFLKLFAELEDIALGTTNIYTAERFNNLFHLLLVLERRQPTLKINSNQALSNATKILSEFLKDESRPNAALQAESMLVFTKLMTNVHDQGTLSASLKEMESILERCERMIGFPYEDTLTMIQELGEGLGALPEYEVLLLKTIELDGKRKGEFSAAISLFNYGIQHLNGKRFYKAIDYIGRSLIGLYKEESKNSFIRALKIIAIAYESCGLLWASRGALINAASYATADFWTYNEINESQVDIYDRLKHIELRLGRIGYVMEWHQLDMVISHSLSRTPEEIDELYKRINRFGHLVGLVLIKTPEDELTSLERLPDLLLKLDLDFGAFGLQYLLSGVKNLPDEFKEIGDTVQLNAFFSKWLDQPAQVDLPERPLFYLSEQVELKSRILGMEIIVTTANESPGIEIAETLLARMESFLSTLIAHDGVSRVPKIIIRLVKNDSGEKLIDFRKDDTGIATLVIEHRQFNPHKLGKEEQDQIGELNYEINCYMLVNFIVFKDTEKALHSLFTGEQVLSRATNFLTSLVTLGNVLGYQPKRSISNWFTDDLKIYPYEPDASRILISSGIRNENDKEQPEPRLEHISHDKLETLGIVDEDLWHEARWGGIVFATDPNPVPKVEPTMGFMFWDGEKASEIFRRWKRHYGDDIQDHFTITIIRGVNRLYPHWYTVVMLPTIPTRNGNRVFNYSIAARCTTMTASSSANLNMFLKSFEIFGRFKIIAAKGGEGIAKLELYEEVIFTFTKLKIKYAWEVSVEDFESAGILLEYDPYIPEGVEDAPILKVLERKRKLKSTQ